MGVAVSCSVLECQQLLHKQLTLMLSLYNIRGANGKVKNKNKIFSYILLQKDNLVYIIIAVYMKDFPQSPSSLLLFRTMAVNVLQLPLPLDGHMQMGFSTLCSVYSFFGAN